MREAAYSWIDYCQLWISSFQFVLSVFGLTGIYFSFIAYKKTIEDQDLTAKQNLATIEKLERLIQSQLEYHRFEQQKHKTSIKPKFRVKKVHNGSLAVKGIVEFEIKNINSIANLVTIELKGSNWVFVNEKGQYTENPRIDTLKENEIVNAFIILAPTKLLGYHLEIENAEVEFNITFFDSNHNHYKQIIYGGIDNLTHLITDDLDN